ncbi:MAG: hypothetical protein ACTSPW_20455 [Promethearchaeota archaeon]
MEALEKNRRTPLGLIKWLESKEEKLNQRIIDLEESAKKFDEAYEKIRNHEKISINDLYEQSINWKKLFRDFKYLIKKSIKFGK